MAFKAQEQSGAKKLVFTHVDPSYNDEKLDEIAQHYQEISDSAYVAYEGLEIVL